ncbi:MAG: secretion system protein E [Burkholderiales bacterium RIFCSPLOWO2_12_FULL_61_40]|nr:MAG: secretion system protein E [Burkholderiales bacterium RIFCSPLOWO2_12_FULL_61_40]
MTQSTPSPSSSHALPSPAQFDQALVLLRHPPPAHGSLWAGLMETLQLSEAVLAAVLSDWHGIAVIDDAQWPKVTLWDKTSGPVMPSTSTTVMGLTLEGRRLLFSEDPWSAEATQALSRSPQSQLALARPGQWAQLAQQLQATPPGGASSAADADAEASTVVQFVDDAVIHAYRDGASDIHFETNRLGVGIKYRLDGVMAAGERLNDPQRAEEVISRIKVMAQLDITERRRPQDGRIHWSRSGHDSIDLRVSIMPSIFGEDAVLRLLDKAQLRQSQQSISLDVLGFDAVLAGTIRALASRPHGMLLITGPTGSGKTTTVYAALSEVNDGLEKIVTIEDPVEYELPGVLQIPVNEQKGLTFATGLRSILRHDPDKILVGEIRDSETAEIAVQSSLTGHLVFTTVHANSLFDVLGRFQHFGIEPFALASALNGVVVQRLMRKLCPHCTGWRAPTPVEKDKLVALEIGVPAQLPVAQGCEQCRHTGYRGRFVVAEVHELSDAVRDLIVRRTSMSELKGVMYREPSSRLVAQAVAKVEQGSTTLEEVIRVVGLV